MRKNCWNESSKVKKISTTIQKMTKKRIYLYYIQRCFISIVVFNHFSVEGLESSMPKIDTIFVVMTVIIYEYQ